MRSLLLLAGLSLLVAGCQSTPGFQCGVSFQVPPTINSTAPLHPMATAPVTAYAVEYPTPAPMVGRYYSVQPAPMQGPAGPTGQIPVTRMQVPIPAERIQQMPRENDCGRP